MIRWISSPMSFAFTVLTRFRARRGGRRRLLLPRCFGGSGFVRCGHTVGALDQDVDRLCDRRQDGVLQLFVGASLTAVTTVLTRRFLGVRLSRDCVLAGRFLLFGGGLPSTDMGGGLAGRERRTRCGRRFQP